MAKFVANSESGPDFFFHCPGCECDHGVWTNKKNQNQAVWNFNGDINNPTVTPSIKVQFPHFKEFVQTELGRIGKEDTCYLHICHSFITNGKIQFLNDCTHKLSAQTVELPEY